MIKKVRKTNKTESVRSDDRSIKVTLIGFNCEGKCRSIKSDATKVLVELPCKANFSLLSFNHHEIEMSCDGEIVFGVPFNRNMSDVLEELAEEAHDNWVNVNSRLNFGRFNRSYEAELSCSGDGIIMLEVNGLDGDQEVEVEGEELPLSSFALAMDADDLGASFDEIVSMLEESEDEFESVCLRRAIKSLTESRDNIRDSIARKMDGNVWDHRSLRDYDFYYNKNNGNLVIVSTFGDKVSIAQVGEGDVKWNHLRSRADINKYFSNSESSWIRDIQI